MSRQTRSIARRYTLSILKVVYGIVFIAVLLLLLLLLMGPTRVGAVTHSRLDGIQPITSPQGFTHPGVFVTLDELKASKKKVQAGEAPWSTIFNQLANSPFVNRTVSDFSEFRSAANIDESCSFADPSGCVASCGSPDSGTPNYGCGVQQNDAKAVYAQALMYYYTGSHLYAERAIEILNAYTNHFKGNRGSNAPLVTAWATNLMVRGAEILRYTYVPRSEGITFNIREFSDLVRHVFVERLTSFNWYNVVGNWMGSGAEAMMSAAVFLDDRHLYNQAVAMWRDYTPYNVYVNTDGQYPSFHDRTNTTDPDERLVNLKCAWLYQKPDACRASPRIDPGDVVFQHGQSKETCRDMEHSAMGLASMINLAETARIQGHDLYGEQQERIMASVTYAVQIAQSYPTHGWPIGFCHGVENLDNTMTLNELPVEVAYNAYTIRKGAKFSTLQIPGYDTIYPDNDPVASFIALRRTTSNNAGLVTSWETLTHHHIAAYIDDPDDGGTDTPTPNPGGSSGPGEDNVPGAPNTGMHRVLVQSNLLPIVGTIGIVLLTFVVWKRKHRS